MSVDDIARSATVERLTGIEYASPGGHVLQLDLYVPQGPRGDTPAVLYLHGGGFVAGRRDDFSDRLVGLAEQGIAVASATYRLAPAAIYPAQLHDARAAVRWLREHGSDYGLQTERVGVWGASAGAALSLLAGFSPFDGDDESLSGVQAVVSWFGGSDFSERAMAVPPSAGSGPPAGVLEIAARDGMNFSPPPHFQLVGAQTAQEAEARLREVSPLNFASRPGPPVLLFHGTADGMVPTDQSTWFHDAVNAAGGDARLLLVHGANHEDEAFHRSEVIGAVAGFLREQLATKVRA